MAIFIPCHGTLLTLVSSKLDAPAEVFRDNTVPASFLDGTVYSV